MPSKRVKFSVEKVDGKRRVKKEIREYEVENDMKTTKCSMTNDRLVGKELRRWYNKTEKYLKDLEKELSATETFESREEVLVKIIKALEYQNTQSQKHKDHCKEKWNRVSIY